MILCRVDQRLKEKISAGFDVAFAVSLRHSHSHSRMPEFPFVRLRYAGGTFVIGNFSEAVVRRGASPKLRAPWFIIQHKATTHHTELHQTNYFDGRSIRIHTRRSKPEGAPLRRSKSIRGPQQYRNDDGGLVCLQLSTR